jgi:hypothetical protein
MAPTRNVSGKSNRRPTTLETGEELRSAAVYDTATTTVALPFFNVGPATGATQRSLPSSLLG